MKMKRACLSLLPLCLAFTAAAEDKVLQEVTVSATADSDVAERREATTQKVVVTRQDIEAMGALTVGDVMSKLPGVDADAGGTAMRSRGMVRDSVQVLIDGERVPGSARMAQAMVGRQPSTELDRVEIVRGASAEFGGSAPVSVNLVFKKARSKESRDLKVAVGARNSEAMGLFSYAQGGGDKGFSWLLPVSLLRNGHATPSDQSLLRQDSTGTHQADETHGRPTTKEFGLSPRLTWSAGSDRLTLAMNLYRSLGRRTNSFEREDFATPANGGSRHDGDTSRSEFNRLRMDGETNRESIKYSMRLAAATSDYTNDMTRDYSPLGGGAYSSSEQTRREEQDWNGALRMDWSAGQHLLAASVERNGHRRDERFDSTGTPAASERHSGNDRQWTAWLQDEWTSQTNVTLTGGLRGEFLGYAADGAGRDYRRLLPSLAVRWEPAERWMLRSSLGAGLKAPKLEELTNQPVYSVSANSPLEPDKRGNPELRAERSANFEAVLERYLPGEGGVFGLNAYLRRTEDFTERRVQLEGARWVERPYNEGSARHWGVEVDGKLRADALGWRGATLRTHLTLPRSRVEDRRLGIVRAARETPRYLLSGGYDQTLDGGASFGVSFQHSGRVRTEVPGEQRYETRRRTVVDAYVLRKLDAHLNLRFSAMNLFRAETRRQMDAEAAPASWWSLATTERGVRVVQVALEGKW